MQIPSEGTLLTALLDPQVDPEPYYHACVQESCSCEFEGKFLGFCTAVAAYAEACSDHNVCVNWRTPDLCRKFFSLLEGVSVKWTGRTTLAHCWCLATFVICDLLHGSGLLRLLQRAGRVQLALRSVWRDAHLQKKHALH